MDDNRQQRIRDAARNACARAKSLEIAIQELEDLAQGEKQHVRDVFTAQFGDLRRALGDARAMLEPLAWPRTGPAPRSSAPRASAPIRRDVDG